MKIIISSKVAEKLTNRLNNHFKSVVHQPVTLEVSMPNDEEVDLQVNSVEGKMTFNCFVEKVK
jgi:hypothetical protein